MRGRGRRRILPKLSVANNTTIGAGAVLLRAVTTRARLCWRSCKAAALESAQLSVRGLRVFKAWRIIDAQLHADTTGHQYWETKALADELLSRGADVRNFSSKSAPVARFPGISVNPTFSPHFYRGRIKNFLMRSRNFQRDLSQTEQLLFLGSLSYFPNVSGPAELLAIIRRLMHFSDPGSPKSSLLWRCRKLKNPVASTE